MQRDSPDLTFLGFFLLAVFGSLVFNEEYLKSTRPDSMSNKHQNHQIENHAYDARLWQDPFGFVIPATKTEKPKPFQILTEPIIERKTEIVKNSKCSYQFRKVIDQFNPTGEIKILAPTVAVDFDNETKEQRIRRRYAVVAGLSESGYVSTEPTELNYCFTEKNDGESYDIRWEYYIHENNNNNQGNKKKRSDILLIWLNNDAFFTHSNKSNALDIMKENLPKLFSGELDNRQLNFNILGPEDSDTLKKFKRIKTEFPKSLGHFIYENYHINEYSYTDPLESIKKINIYSPRATVSNINIPNILGNNIEFLRTIGTDKALTKILVDELKLRNIDELSEVAIIAERDTNYSRNLIENFCTAYGGNKMTPCSNANIYYYLRGMDANQGASAQEDNKQNTQETSKENRSVDQTHNSTIGPSQLDYLRRMADEIKRLHEDANDSNTDSNKPIKAIGIFGTDIYDTLLILQALQQEFQNILFFTTDLDARMIQPHNFRWTRNLIVASNFDLKLKRALQKHTPPFRDSYQTSVYLSTLMAINFDESIIENLQGNKHAVINNHTVTNISNDDPTFTINENIINDKFNVIINENIRCIREKSFMECNPPLLFEIGRNGPVRLEMHNEYGQTLPHIYNNNSIVHPKLSNTNQHTPILFALILITVVLIVTLRQIRPNSNKLILSIVCPILILLSAAFFAAYDKDGDPLTFTDGVSVWPTILIRLIVIILVVAFIIKAIRDIEINFYRLSREYCNDKENKKHPTLFTTQKNNSLSEIYIQNTNKYLLALLFIVIGIYGKAFFMDYVRSLATIYQSLFALSVFWAITLILWFYAINHMHKIKSVNQWVESSSNNKEPISLEDLWAEYYQHGRLEHRTLRVVSLWLLFMAISSVLFLMLPPPPSPCRGSTCDIDQFVLVLSFTMVMLLIFFAIDAIRICFYWMKKLRTEHVFKTYDNKTLAHNQLKSLGSTVELVAERTNDVDKLIYYPLIVIILMLFARNNYFDNIGFPLGLIIIVLINIIMLIAAGLNLRMEAQKLRDSATRCTKKQKETRSFTSSVQKIEAHQEIDQIVNEMQSIQHGAFQPLRNQPVIRTLLLILGSAGLAASEYVMMAG